MIRPTINFRVLLLAVLPTTVVSIIFFSYFVNKQVDDIEENLVENGKSLASHLASASEYGIFSGNMAILSPLIDAAITKNNVISITITNNQGTPLIKKSKSKEPGTTIFKDTYNRVFSQPVVQHAIDINDFENTEDDIPPVIGWVIVEVSDKAAIKNKQEAILQTLSITLLVLISSIFLATRISRHITEPISSLTTAVNEIESGNLNVAIETHSTGAVLGLEKGIRSMLQSIKSSHWEAQSAIEKSTKELRKSLELLENQNTELSITRQQALSASQAKSAFLANISHEIRTPMNGILGFVKLLKASNPTPEQAEYIFTIEQSANNLLRIINDVLDFSKIEAGKITINNVHFNLEESIEDVLALIAPSAHEKGIELTSLYYDDTPRNLFGAIDRIRQILINLIGNAIKFSDSGTIMVRTMVESRNNDIVKIKITITDQGSGIAEKDKNSLFSSFSQIDDSDTRQYGGTGLGLAISKSLSEAMRGEIGVDSRKNIGSTFWFTFECQSKDAVDMFTEDKDQPYKQKSIKLYDTNELSRLSLEHAFRRLGFTITECMEIEEFFMEQNANDRADILALSLSSSEATDETIKSHLKKFKNIKHPAILALVSSSDSMVLKTLQDCGADSCLSKPFRYADLKKKLTAIFHTPDSPSSPILENHKNDAQTQVRLNGLNVLVAEDNIINAKLIETILLRNGATLEVVKNGQEAVRAFKNNNYDVILMDIHMPIMNGIDAAREIRNTENNGKRIAIIGLTAMSKIKDEEFFENADFDEVLEKPIAVDELLHEITYWVHAHKSATHRDREAIRSKNNLGIDRGLSTTLNEMLLYELPTAKKKLKNAFDSGDYRFMRGEIHRLLGGMAYCNFDKLRELTLQFQTSLKANSSTLPDDFNSLIAEMDRLINSDLS